MQDLAVGLIAFAQYALLSPIRKTINPRFDFTTPLVAGLFYIAPGLGFLLGTASGGQLSDRTVRKWIVKRGNVRIPRDRLRDIVVPVFFVIPLAFLLYGWCLQKRFGALALPVVTAFFAGLGLTGSLPCLNTYSAGQCYRFPERNLRKSTYQCPTQNLCQLIVRRSYRGSSSYSISSRPLVRRPWSS